MLLRGKLVNAKNAQDDTSFEGYSVLLTYLVMSSDGETRVFKETSDNYPIAYGSNEFQFEIPDIERLEQDSVFTVVVFGNNGKEVFSEKFPLVDTIKEQLNQKPIVIKIKPAEPEKELEALPISGVLQWKDAPQDRVGFGKYSVVLRYKAKFDLGGNRVTSQAELSTNCSDNGAFVFDLPVDRLPTVNNIELAPKYPSGTLGTFETKSISQSREKIVIAVVRQQATALTNDPRAQNAMMEKTKGKVVDLLGKVQIKNKQVIIWGWKTEVAAPQPILVAVTDPFGGFSGERSKEEFLKLVATVAGTNSATLETALPVDLEISLDDNGREKKSGLLPKFVYLVVDVDEAKDNSDDCSCHDGQTPRLPDAEDLISNPSTYSQDIGINCVNFTTPNRTLEEFTYTMVVRTTDPEIKSTTISDVEKRQFHFERFERALSLDLEKASPTIAALAEVGTKSAAMVIADAISSHPQSDRTQTTGFNLSKSFAGSFALKDITQKYRYTELAAMVPGRTELNASTAIDWDSTPTFYQAATIAHGHILHFKQQWKADGYSMGDLLYSLPLAPGQKKQIVIFDWDRTEFGRRDEDNHEDSALNAYLSNNRDVTDIVRGSFAEQTSGSSSSSTSGRAGGIGGAVGGMIKGIFFGAVGGFSASGGDSESSASQSSSRQIATTGLQQLHQVINQGASSVRNARQTVVQTGRQTERFKVETEVVANHNHCHAITIEYFEVLRHYAIESRLSHVQECLFIPLLITKFDVAKVVRWRNIIQDYLKLPPPRGLSSIFGAHPLIRGLDACERIHSAYEGSDFPTGMYANEAIESISGEIWVTFQLNRPRDPEDDNPKTDPTSSIVGGLIGAAWGPVGAILGGLSGLAVTERYFKGHSVADKGRIFEERIAPEMARAIVDQLKFEAIRQDGSAVSLNVEPTLVSNYHRDAKLYVTVRPNGGVPAVTRADIRSIRISTTADLAASERSKIIVTGAHFRYSTPHMDGFLCRDDNVDNDLLPPISVQIGVPPYLSIVKVNEGDPVVIPTPLNAEEKRNPRKEDIQFSRKLLDHLNADIEYYHKMIWLNMDPDRRFMLLDGHIAPNTKGPGNNGRSVASVVENQVIGIVGNCLVMPVAPGYRLDPTYKVNPILDEQTGKPMKDSDGNLIYPATDLLDHYKPLTPVPPFRVSVPTRGVFAEAVMGACNSCERKDETRFWRWEESPNPDEPTAINPIQTTPPQRSDPGDLKASPFSAPIIAMQNAPAAPDPGSTVAGALNLLGKSDIFKDITGLEQNQKNALQGMLSNQESAKHYADKAVEMAKMAAMQKNGNQTVDNIRQSVEKGDISKEVGGKLIEDAYRTQISGKTNSDEASQKDSASNSKLGEAIAQRVEAGAEISATQDHKDGTKTTVDQKASAEASAKASASIDFLPRQHFELDLAAEISMNAKLELAITNAKLSMSASEKISIENVGIFICCLSRTNTISFAEIRGGLMYFSASVLEICLLYATSILLKQVQIFAEQTTVTTEAEFFATLEAAWSTQSEGLIPALGDPVVSKILFSEIFSLSRTSASGGAKFTVSLRASYRSELNKVFAKQSSNASVTYCVHRLGFKYINAVLEAGGFSDANSRSGIWWATDFVDDNVPVSASAWPSYELALTATGGRSAAAMTCKAMGQLLSASYQNQIPLGNDLIFANILGGDAWVEKAPNKASFEFRSKGAKIGISASTSAKVGVIKSEAAVFSRTSDNKDFLVVWSNLPDDFRLEKYYPIFDDVIKAWPN
jgi:hypothetical protein